MTQATFDFLSTVVAYRMSPDQLRPITAAEFYRAGIEDSTWWASRDVQGAHDRFRRFYLGKVASLSLCRCMAHVEPHLHAPRRLRRIGHLPMMTMKELPE